MTSMKYNPKNERIKREYFRYQKNAMGKAEATLDGIRKAIERFETYTRHSDFITFNREQAIAFKKHLAGQKNQRTGETVSKATMLTTVAALQEFLRWLAFQPGYKSRLHIPDIDYLNLTEKETTVAKTLKYRPFPTLTQIHKAIFSMPVETDIQRRNRALLAFAILTGMRDNALASLRLKHVDLTQTPILVRQEPDKVNTKFSKQIMTFFFPVGDDIRDVAVAWVKELLESKLYSLNDPVFPRTKMGHDENQSFTVQGLEPVCWSNATAIRRIFKEAFEGAGLPYFNPHSFRHTLGHMAGEYCKTPEQLRAWSQNLGHENIQTTLTSYSKIDPYRQGEVMKGLSRDSEESQHDLLNQLLQQLQKINA